MVRSSPIPSERRGGFQSCNCLTVGESSGDDYSITLVKAELLYRSRVLENTELDPTQNILPSPIGYWDIFWKDRCEEDRPPISR
eukprot:scaffold12008_cov174-Skeletonema_menzelii.AAC.1